MPSRWSAGAPTIPEPGSQHMIQLRVIITKLTDLDSFPVHLPFNSLLQCQQRNMHCILQLQVVFIPLLQKRLGACRTLPNGGRCNSESVSPFSGKRWL